MVLVPLISIHLHKSLDQWQYLQRLLLLADRIVVHSNMIVQYGAGEMMHNFRSEMEIDLLLIVMYPIKSFPLPDISNTNNLSPHVVEQKQDMQTMVMIVMTMI